MNRTTRFVVLAAGFLAPAAMAQSYSTGFEAPLFSTGSINGQNGWSVTNPSYAQAVTTADAHSGTQSWLRGDTYGTGAFGDQPFSPGLGVGVGEASSVGATPGYNTVTTSIWFKPANASADGSVVGFAGTDAGGSRMWNINFRNLSGVGVQIAAFDADVTGEDFNEYVLGSNLDPSVWHSLSVTATFNNGLYNDTVAYSLDGGAATVIGSWEQYYRLNPEQLGNGNQVYAMDRAIFRTVSSAAGANGFYFDDFSMNASVPAPGALALAGVGGLLVSRRRR